MATTAFSPSTFTSAAQAAVLPYKETPNLPSTAASPTASRRQTSPHPSSPLYCPGPQRAHPRQRRLQRIRFRRPAADLRQRPQLRDLDEVTGVSEEERYSYLFDMSCQELDHLYMSAALTRGAEFAHMHFNTWASYADEISDHDPSTASFVLVIGLRGKEKRNDNDY
ncbi:hypothetical protein LSUE1_G004341 [Lachnellula suecica]|uniref:Uncharacterized protein n=1 Tax=Lachnellula suecica TaxID=602035 RepID=A0A8T9C0C6_9HELO|nr:hypothetical protein LSUE1_G004341 [Lachnellula suecica]